MKIQYILLIFSFFFLLIFLAKLFPNTLGKFIFFWVGPKPKRDMSALVYYLRWALVSFVSFLLLMLFLGVGAYFIFQNNYSLDKHPVIAAIFMFALPIFIFAAFFRLIGTLAKALRYRKRTLPIAEDQSTYIPDKNMLPDIFYEKFTEFFPEMPINVEGDGCYVVSHDSPNGVGYLRVDIDCTGVIIGLGDLWHMHFDFFGPDKEVDEKTVAEQTVEAAINCIKDILNDKVLLKEKMKDGKVISAKAYYLEDGEERFLSVISGFSLIALNIFKRPDNRQYVWSHIIENL